jgi:hypothetical protein
LDGQLAADDGDRQGGEAAPDPGPPAPEDGRTRIVRALLDALEEVELEDDDSGVAKEELRRSLLAADGELSRVLGGNSKRLILEANKKPLVPMIGERTSRPAHTSPGGEPARQPRPEVLGDGGAAEEGVSGPSVEPEPEKDASESDEPKTHLVRSLLDSLDEIETDDPEDKEELRRILMDADRELRRISGPVGR